MRLVVFVTIILLFGFIGYEIKRKYIEQKEFLKFFKSFLDYFYLNISIYKNNISEIINNYLIQQNNKNAKYVKIFQKNNNLYEINKKIINDYIYSDELKLILDSYLNGIGKSDIKSECEKTKAVLKSVDIHLEKTTEDIKSKGDLYFKICLVIGVVVVIVLW